MGVSSKTKLNVLRRLLGKCLKNICKASRNDVVVDMKFLTFNQIYKKFYHILNYRFYTMNLGPYFKDKIEISNTEQH